MDYDEAWLFASKLSDLVAGRPSFATLPAGDVGLTAHNRTANESRHLAAALWRPPPPQASTPYGAVGGMSPSAAPRAAARPGGLGADGARQALEALLDLGQPRDALVSLQPLLEGGGADEWTLGARICLELGSPSDAETFGRTAASLGRIGGAHPYRKFRYGASSAPLGGGKS